MYERYLECQRGRAGNRSRRATSITRLRAGSRLVAAIAAVLLLVSAGPWAIAAEALVWTRLPDLPDAEGFAGPFAGVSHGALVVAGGANFPDAKPWQGGSKVWYDSIHVLDKPDGAWRSIDKLPRPLGYGVSLTTERGIVCIGGSDAQRHYADCFLLAVEGNVARTSSLPALPRPCANACGALLGRSIYVAGGLEEASDAVALKTFWALDLDHIDQGWQELDPWPGEGRMLATAGVQDGAFHLFGGAALLAGSDGAPVRRWLRDCYRFVPGRGWQRIADLPRAVVAAPSPAPAIGQTHLLVLGGDDGKQVNDPPQTHRGFGREVLAYHTDTGTWSVQGKLPFSLVTTLVVRWNERIVVPGGEAKPGVRSVEVWSGATAAARCSLPSAPGCTCSTRARRRSSIPR